MLEGYFQEEEEEPIRLNFAKVPLSLLTRRPPSIPQSSSSYSSESEAARAPFEQSLRYLVDFGRRSGWGRSLIE